MVLSPPCAFCTPAGLPGAKGPAPLPSANALVTDKDAAKMADIATRMLSPRGAPKPKTRQIEKGSEKIGRGEPANYFRSPRSSLHRKGEAADLFQDPPAPLPIERLDEKAEQQRRRQTGDQQQRTRRTEPRLQCQHGRQ